MKNTLNKTHTHIIGFSYQREEDGELCDFTGEIYACISGIAELEKEIEEMECPIHKVKEECWQKPNGHARRTPLITYKEVYNPFHTNLNIEHEVWKGTLFNSLEISGVDDSDWENVHYEYNEKIDKRTKEYRSAA
jgi:hypothetical protein